ncbi:MAG: hypothetical protein M3R12_05065 [Actinomycetota bacterium]|nr:hypothetical protein [Actinomycetota bacterium]
MGLVVLLLSDAPEGLTLGPKAMASLADLGVTSAALVRDSETVGLVLEGWAFDEEGAELAAAAVAGPSAPHRTLLPLAQMAVTAAAPSRRSTA